MGLLVLTFNIVISGHISALRRKAASIQELYDCRVLGIRRNELKVEEIPRDDIIREAAYFQRQPGKSTKAIWREGWYVSKVYDAPQAVMALLCHGKNLGGTNRSGRFCTYFIFPLLLSRLSRCLFTASS